MLNIESQLRVLSKLSGKFKHICPDLNGLAIDENSPEFSKCQLYTDPLIVGVKTLQSNKEEAGN